MSAQKGFNIENHRLAVNSLKLNADKIKYITFSIRNAALFLVYTMIYTNALPPNVPVAAKL